jgi:outer membrane protein assembly factor BamB
MLALCICLLCAHKGSSQEAAASAARAGRILEGSDFHGGLIVLVGAKDADLALALGAAPNSVVHCLVSNADALAPLRTRVTEEGMYGRVSAMYWASNHLPYADAMVNVLVIADGGHSLVEGETERVLSYGGTAWTLADGAPQPHRRSRPDDVDSWSHSRYDATGNAVSRDRRVGPPEYLQWTAWPRWNRGTKTSCVVSARGRIFYILNDGHFAVGGGAWALIARDASNGIQLWRHELTGWEGARGGKKVGPAQVHRRLVALEDRVYATLDEGAPVSVLNAATGEVIRTLEGTASAEEFIVSNGVLLALVAPVTDAEKRRGATGRLRIVAVDPASGASLWQHEEKTVLPLTLASDGTQVVFHDGSCIRSLDLRSGEVRWSSPPTGQKIAHWDRANADRPGSEKGVIALAPQFAPTLIMYDGVVAFAGGQQLNVVSADDGRELWRSEYAASNYSVPVDLFGFGGKLWGPDPGMNLWRPLDDNIDFNAFDPQTGKPVEKVEGDYGFRFQHHRCNQMKAVGDSVIAARAGVEFLDTGTGAVNANHWLRGSCFYGVMPANGLLYVPPHNCVCYVRAKLSGFMALRSSEPASAVLPADARLEHGPAYGAPFADDAGNGADDWPTYRHDPGRSGRTSTAVDRDLLLGWQVDLGDSLTSPVIAGGQVYVASRDEHMLVALDAATGEVAWLRILDARIDSPPTVYRGLVLCGCRDGSVSALRAEDGALVWRFIARPAERFIVSLGQVESAWPVYGSVLVANDTVYFAAGRTSYLDGGLKLYGLEPGSGNVVVERTLWTRDAEGQQWLDEESVNGYLNDILSSDGERIFMRHQALGFDGSPEPARINHLHGPDGFLSSDTTPRLLWTYAPSYSCPHQGAFYDLWLNRVLFPSGRILVEDEKTIYGYGQNHYEKMRVDPGGTNALFSAVKAHGTPLDLTAKEYRKLGLSGKHSVTFNWWKRIPIQAWALVRTKDTLFVAGPRGSSVTSPAALRGEGGASLLAVSPADGSVLAEMALPSMPVWDGMAAAGGNLYLALMNGDVVCLWSVASGRPGTPLSAAGWRAALPPVKIAEEPGLVGRWRFDEGDGMLARDCSGQGHDAEVTGRWGKGEFGTCLVVDAVPSAAIIPDAAHLRFGTESFTLALWVAVKSYDVRLLGKEAFPESWWVINLPGDGHAELVLGEGRGNGMSVRPKTKAPIPLDAWTHLVAAVDRESREVRWYVNGELDSTAPIPKTMTKGLDVAGRDIAIPSSHKPFRGLIGDMRIYRRAVSDDDVKQLYAEQAARRTSTALQNAAH